MRDRSYMRVAMRIDTFSHGRRTNKTTRYRAPDRSNKYWWPYVNDDGTWFWDDDSSQISHYAWGMHNARCPVPIAKVRAFRAWRQTAEIKHGSASGTSRQRRAARLRGLKRAAKKRRLCAIFIAARDDAAADYKHARKQGFQRRDIYRGMGY